MTLQILVLHPLKKLKHFSKEQKNMHFIHLKQTVTQLYFVLIEGVYRKLFHGFLWNFRNDI